MHTKSRSSTTYNALEPILTEQTIAPPRQAPSAYVDNGTRRWPHDGRQARHHVLANLESCRRRIRRRPQQRRRPRQHSLFWRS